MNPLLISFFFNFVSSPLYYLISPLFSVLSLMSQNSPNSHPRNEKNHPISNDSLLCTCSEVTHLSLLSTDHPPLLSHHVPSAGDTQKSKATFIFQSDSYTRIYILFHFFLLKTHTRSLSHINYTQKREKKNSRFLSLGLISTVSTDSAQDKQWEGAHDKRNYDGSEGSVFCRICLHCDRRRWGSISGDFSQLYSQHAFSTDSV